MRPEELPTLPPWAKYETLADGDPRGEHGHVRFNGNSVCVEVDGGRAYPAVLEEYRRRYGNGDRPDFLPRMREGADFWPLLLEELTDETPSAYWLEVAYQTMKMDVQRVTGPAANIHITATVTTEGESVRKLYAQATAPEGSRSVERAAGRYVDIAAGGVMRSGTEARQHYKLLRGFLVA